MYNPPMRKVAKITKSEVVYTRLEPALKSWLVAHAQVRGVTLSHLLAQAAQAYREKQERENSGLVITVDHRPYDRR